MKFLNIVILIFFCLNLSAQNIFQRLKYSAPLEFSSGFFRGVGDNLQFKFELTIFSNAEKYNPRKWNPAISHREKWKQYPGGAVILPRKPKYLGSTTFLAWSTDKWHGLNTLSISAQQMSIVTYNQRFENISTDKKVIDFLILKTVYSLGWHVADRIIKK